MSASSKADWERVFQAKRQIERLMERHTLADVEARDEEVRRRATADYPGNRHERRAAARKAAR